MDSTTLLHRVMVEKHIFRSRFPLIMVSTEFTKPELEQFLSKRLIAKIATNGLDGFPHVVPIWFLHAERKILMATGGHSMKVRNIKADRRVSVLIDSAKQGYENRGVLFGGHAEILEGKVARKTNELIYKKYMGIKALRKPKVIASLLEDDITIEFNPERIVSWDNTKSAVSRIKGLVLQF